MNASSLQTIRERVEESRGQLKRVRELLPNTPAPSLRADFARSAIDLACEHHCAIVELVSAAKYGAAAAMLRPLLEASTTASWLLYAADCSYIQALPKNAETAEGRGRDIPQLEDMLKQLTPTFPGIQSLLEAMRNKGPASWLHKYTHGGAVQLVRRGAGWQFKEVIAMLIRADLFGLLGATSETVIAPNSDLSAYVFPRRDDLGAEMFRRFGVSPGQTVERFPPALKDGCGPPFSSEAL
jgi:hypothetical protein